MEKQFQIEKIAKGMPVLVVDDDESFLFAIQYQLQALGLVVSKASDGNAGWLAFSRQEALKFVITDFDMPGLTGVELAKRVRKARPESHVILLTAHKNNQELRDFYFGGDYQVYMVSKSEMERPVVGLMDTLFTALARLSSHRP